MKKIAVIIANGSEEIETLTPLDVLRRAGVYCDLISVGGKNPTCSHSVTILADKTIENIDFSVYDGIIIPGGMPGATNIANDQKVVCAIKEFSKNGKLVAAICASPAVVLAANGVVDGKRATCYPVDDFIKMMGESYVGGSVVIEKNIITANGPKAAFEFSMAICDFLGVEAKF